MAVSIDGETLIITLESGITNVDWIDVYSDWKEWMLASPSNRGYPQAFRTSGGDPLNAFLNQGAYWFLRNDLGWRIKPPEEDITIYASGNLAAEDSDLPIFVPTTGAYTAAIIGLQPITQGFSLELAQNLEYGAFAGGVHLDTGGAYSGTTFPTGTPKQPVNNLADAMLIATERGFTTVFVTGDATIDNGGDYREFHFIGDSMSRTTLTIDADAQVDDCEFSECTVTGTLDGDCKLKECVVQDVNYISGYIELCVLQGTILLGGGAVATFLDCWAGSILGTPPTVDMGGAGQTLVMQNFNGLVQVKNKTGASEECNMSLNAGWVILDSTITAGNVNIIGVGTVQDSSTGTTVVNTDHLIDAQQITDLHRLQGLDAANPVTMTPTGATVGTITQVYSGDGETTKTVTRQ